MGCDQWPPFSIVFDPATPFADRTLPFSAATQPLRPLTKGWFKYSIVSDENPDLKLDPLVIIDPPPSQP
jgi:hypothetical protein